MSIILRIGQYANRMACDFVWSNTYGLGRALLATGLMITMLLNDIELLVYPLGKEETTIDLEQLSMVRWSLYNLFPENLMAIKGFTILVLFLVIIGWRPRITGIFHWWVTFSFTVSAMVVDGGDQIAQVLSLLLIPLCLADRRPWHWTKVNIPQDGISPNLSQKIANLVAASTLIVIQLQVSFIYFHACVGKFKVEEWVNGTSLFYWIQNPIFGANEGLQPLLITLFSNPYIISFSTWGVLLLELALAAGILLAPKWRRYLLFIGLLFHFTIIFLHGLVSFFFTMAAALTLYLGPRQGYSIKNWKFQWPESLSHFSWKTSRLSE